MRISAARPSQPTLRAGAVRAERGRRRAVGSDDRPCLLGRRPRDPKTVAYIINTPAVTINLQTVGTANIPSSSATRIGPAPGLLGTDFSAEVHRSHTRTDRDVRTAAGGTRMGMSTLLGHRIHLRAF